MNLKNKVVLVTGASRGIGRATALAFAREGCHVVINYYQEKSKAVAVANQIKKLGRKVLVVKADVASFKEFKFMVEKTMKEFKRLDILVNNAGLIIQTNQDYQQIDDQVWERTLDVNLKGVLNGIKLVAPLMKKQKQGRIINLENLTKAFAIAASIVFLAQSDFITGQILNVDGGYGLK